MRLHATHFITGNYVICSAANLYSADASGNEERRCSFSVNAHVKDMWMTTKRLQSNKT